MAKRSYAKITLDKVLIAIEVKDDSTQFMSRAQAINRGKTEYWVPHTPRGPMPAYNPDTQHEPQPARNIIQTAVTDSWLAPVAKTAQEIDDDNTVKADGVASNLVAEILRRTMATQLAVINDVRTRHGDTPVSPAAYLNYWNTSADGFSLAQFKAVIKGLL